jgi:hypothetical protein
LAEIREPLRPQNELTDYEKSPALPDEIERPRDPARLPITPSGYHFFKKSTQLLFESIVDRLAGVNDRGGRTK